MKTALTHLEGSACRRADSREPQREHAVAARRLRVHGRARDTARPLCHGHDLVQFAQTLLPVTWASRNTPTTDTERTYDTPIHIHVKVW